MFVGIICIKKVLLLLQLFHTLLKFRSCSWGTICLTTKICLLWHTYLLLSTTSIFTLDLTPHRIHRLKQINLLNYFVSRRMSQKWYRYLKWFSPLYQIFENRTTPKFILHPHPPILEILAHHLILKCVLTLQGLYSNPFHFQQ